MDDKEQTLHPSESIKASSAATEAPVVTKRQRGQRGTAGETQGIKGCWVRLEREAGAEANIKQSGVASISTDGVAGDGCGDGLCSQLSLATFKVCCQCQRRRGREGGALYGPNPCCTSNSSLLH